MKENGVSLNSKISRLTKVQKQILILMIGLYIVSFGFNIYSYVRPIVTSYGYTDVAWGPGVGGMISSIGFLTSYVGFIAAFRNGTFARRVLLIMTFIYAAAVVIIWLLSFAVFESLVLRIVLTFVIIPFYGFSYFFEFGNLENVQFLQGEYWISESSFRICFTVIIVLLLVLSVILLMLGNHKTLCHKRMKKHESQNM